MDVFRGVLASVPDAVEPQVRVNPAGLDATSDAAFVGRCFGTHWSAATYRSYLRRPSAGTGSVRIILTIGGRAAASCGLAYRILRTPDGAYHRVGVIVAAGTLPGDRGRGYYARLLDAAIERGAALGCVALLGFVTASNATERGLRNRGAIAVESSYIAAGPLAPIAGHASLRLEARVSIQRWYGHTGSSSDGSGAEKSIRFYYPTAEVWRAQHVERPHGIEPVRLGTTTRALVEVVGDTERLQWLEGPQRERPTAVATLAAGAQRARHRFFMYSTVATDRTLVQRLGLRVVPGYLMALATSICHQPTVDGWRTMPWCVQSCDRL